MGEPTPDLLTPAQLVDLSGRAFVVTGAAGGIGTGIVQRLVAAGASVMAHTHSHPMAAGDISSSGSAGQVEFVSADLTTAEGPQTVLDAAIDHFGRLDGLVNNAGTQPIVPLDEITPAQWRQLFELNLDAPYRLTQLAAEAMQSQRRAGSVVHIASIESRHPTTTHGHYASSKAALVTHAKAAALFYGPCQIRVNSISPGLIYRHGIEADWPEGVERWKSAAPLGRLGTPDDIGDACVFLLSDLARWITGVDLIVDGGVLTNPTW